MFSVLVDSCFLVSLFQTELDILGVVSFIMSPSLWSRLARPILSASLLLQVTLAAPYVPSNSTNTSLPIVDLGYELHQAAFFNSTGGFYNFSNVRYAAPPTGDLRFRPPQPPAQNRGEVQTGDVGRICAQASPAWELIAAQ